MTFQEATSRLMEAGVQLEDMAMALGIAYQTIRVYRISPEASSHKPPPPNWRPALARLARERSHALAGLAAEMETVG